MNNKTKMLANFYLQKEATDDEVRIYIYTLVNKKERYILVCWQILQYFFYNQKYRRHGNIRASILHLLNPKTGIFSESVRVWRRVKAMGGKVQKWHLSANKPKYTFLLLTSVYTHNTVLVLLYRLS